MSLLRTVSNRLIRPTIIYCTKRTFQQSSYKYIVPEITVLKKNSFGLKQHKHSLHTSSALNNVYNARF